MGGTATFTAANAFKQAFYAQAVSLFSSDPNVLVTFGHQGIQNNVDVIRLGELTSSQVPATLSNALRTREETLTLKVQIASYDAGESDNDLVASTRVYYLMGILENYVRTTDTTLGGVVRQCFLTSHVSPGMTDGGLVGGGRIIESEATFTALVRITS